jgi:hypothetical protein
VQELEELDPPPLHHSRIVHLFERSRGHESHDWVLIWSITITSDRANHSPRSPTCYQTHAATPAEHDLQGARRADERAAGQLPQLLGGLAVTRRDRDAGVLSFGATDGGWVDGGVADGVVPGESESEVVAGRRYFSPQKNITIEWCTRSMRKACREYLIGRITCAPGTSDEPAR